jgi:hypothetical protein
MTPRFLEELGVFVDLAADDRAQPGHDVAAEPAAAHDDPEALALDLGDAVMRDVFGRDDEHRRSPKRCEANVRAKGVCGIA